MAFAFRNFVIAIGCLGVVLGFGGMIVDCFFNAVWPVTAVGFLLWWIAGETLCKIDGDED
jgi:hypothetical protein